jgi:predicted methyltransferase
MHNLVRFEKDGKFLTDALSQTHKMLKSGGLVGIVQHQAAESKTDAWADGSSGYVKKSRVIKAMTDAGFELVAESDVNTNPKDQPGDTDTVWRLAPSFYTSQENTEQRIKYQAIGESNRMTLLFRKP